MRLEKLAVVGLLSVSVAACVVVPLDIGRSPRIELLESALEVGRTTRGQVLEIVGPPAGVGRVNLAFHSEPRILWNYVHQAGDLNDPRQTLLWVFFDGDVYEGYMWLSTE
jgi:hypothetical protein